MIIPTAYAVLVWIMLYAHRGRWQALLLLLISMIPPAVLTVSLSYAARQGNDLPSANFFINNLAGMGMIFHIFTGSFTLILFSVGLVIAVQKPRLHHAFECTACGYDLAGNETGECPECAVMLSNDQINRLARTPQQPRHPGGAPDFASDTDAETAGAQHLRPRRMPAHLSTSRTG